MARKISQPTSIPVPGGKRIDEYIGRVHTGTTTLSVAHMVAPPGWAEPFQKPDFDEVTIVLRGTMRLEYDGGVLDASAGETILTEAGERIRYCNPFSTEAEYWAVCAPAFSPETAHRDE